MADALEISQSTIPLFVLDGDIDMALLPRSAESAVSTLSGLACATVEDCFCVLAVRFDGGGSESELVSDDVGMVIIFGISTRTEDMLFRTPPPVTPSRMGIARCLGVWWEGGADGELSVR